MDRVKFDQMVELLKEGKGAKAISKAIGQSHGIVDWNLLFIKVHGVETARLYNDGIGRPSYNKEQILGIYNFALVSDCGFERAEIYFKIKRNKLLEKVKKYIGKENIGKEAENAVPMYPDVKRNCDEFIATIPDELLGLSPNSPVSPFKGISEEELLNSPLATGVQPKPVPVNDEAVFKVDISERENFATFEQDTSRDVEPNNLSPRVFGRAKAALKKYKQKKIFRSKYLTQQSKEQIKAIMECAPLYATNLLYKLWCDSLQRGLLLNKLELNLLYSGIVQQLQNFAALCPYADPEDVKSQDHEANQGQDIAAIKPPKVSLFDKIDYYLGPYPERVPASNYKPNSRAKLPRIDSLSEGFDKLPQHVKDKIYHREMQEAEIRKAAASLIGDDDKLDLKHHMLVKWRFKAALYLINNNPEWSPSLIKKMVGLTKDEYYYYSHNMDKLDPYEIIKPRIKECFEVHGKGKAGCRSMLDLLRRHYGIYLSIFTIRRLMKECGVAAPSQRKRKKPYSSHVRGLPDIFPNLLNRDFSSNVFGQKVVTDISEFEINGTKVYLSLYMDLATKMILTATVSKAPSVAMVVDGLKKALSVIPSDRYTILHSDQGHHYKRHAYIEQAIKSGRVFLSNSRKGNCYDNGECEGRFSIIKYEMFHGKKFNSVNEFASALFSYCAWYNMYRPQTGLGGLTPLEKKTVLEREFYAHKNLNDLMMSAA